MRALKVNKQEIMVKVWERKVFCILVAAAVSSLVAKRFQSMGGNGVRQLGRVFVAKDANEFVRDAKPRCFIKSHYFAFPQSFQGAITQSRYWPPQLWERHTYVRRQHRRLNSLGGQSLGLK